MSDSAERTWAERELAAELRTSEGDLRDRVADERDDVADRRERQADRREDQADDREAALDAWERRLEFWERALAERERMLDEHAIAEAHTLAELVEASQTTISHSYAVLERARDALERIQAQQGRLTARGSREQKKVDRQVDAARRAGRGDTPAP